MDNLISHEALIEDFKKAFWQESQQVYLQKSLAIINNAPTVEIKQCPYELMLKRYCVPRQQGEWINHRNDNGHNIANCSLCGKAMQWHDEDEDGVPRFSWYCGAAMELKGGEKDG